MSAPTKVLIVRHRGSFRVVREDNKELVTGGYGSARAAANAARDLRCLIVGDEADTPAHLAYFKIFGREFGFNESGFDGFKRGYDAAIEESATTHAQLRQALEKIDSRDFTHDEPYPKELDDSCGANVLAPILAAYLERTEEAYKQVARSALALPPMEGRE